MSREGEGQHPDDDVTLVARVGRRDPAALRLLFDRHAPALLRFAHAIARDRALAEDAVQESFAALWQHAASFRNESSPRSWLFTVARNAIHRRFRRKVDRDTDVALEELGADAGWGDASAQRSVHERIESDDCVRHALSTLDDDDREVLALIDVEGLSADEGAQALGLSVAALKSRLHRARLRFVAAVRKEDDR